MRVLFCLRGQDLVGQWRKAAGFVRLADHQVWVLHVVNTSLVDEYQKAQGHRLGGSTPGHLEESAASMRQAAIQRGEAILAQVKSLAEAEGVPVTPLLEEGPVEDVILHVAQQLGIEFLIIGRQHQGFERFILGGTSRFVVDRAPCSVLILK